MKVDWSSVWHIGIVKCSIIGYTIVPKGEEEKIRAEQVVTFLIIMAIASSEFCGNNQKVRHLSMFLNSYFFSHEDSTPKISVYSTILSQFLLLCSAEE